MNEPSVAHHASGDDAFVMCLVSRYGLKPLPPDIVVQPNGSLR